MRSNSIIWIILLAILAADCKTSDPSLPGSPTYYIVSTSSQMKSVIAVGNPSGVSNSAAYTMNPGPNADWIADAVIADNKMFVLRSNSNTVEILDLPGLAVSKTIKFSKAIASSCKHIDYVNGKIMVTWGVPSQAGLPSFSLGKIDPGTGKMDSLIFSGNQVFDLTHSGDKIFISKGSVNSILKLDATSFSSNVEFDMGIGNKPATKILLDKNGSMLMSVDGKMLRMDQGGSVLSQPLIGVSSYYPSSPGITNFSRYTLDDDQFIIYFLRVANFNSATPFVLSSSDAFGNVKDLNSTPISATTISFDPLNKFILVGDKTSTEGIINIYNTSGELKAQRKVAQDPADILVQN